MRANTRTLLTLYEWFEIIGYHPFYAAQIGTNVPARSAGQCDDVLYQYNWQRSDQLSREDIAEAIQQAEELIARAIGYFPAPQYIQNEKHQYPERYDRRAFGNMLTARGAWRAVQTDYAHIQTIGIESLVANTGVANPVAVAYSDADGDGVNDTFTVTAAVPAGTTADEVALFFVSADRAGLTQAETEIRPLDVSISAGVATIKGSRTLMVLPAVQLALSPSKIDATLATDFAATVDVYIRSTDTTNTGTLIWETLPEYIAWQYNGSDCTPPCQVEITTACFGARDAETGWIYPIPASYDSDTTAFVAAIPPQYRQPDRITVNYLAGFPRNSRGRMDRRLARAVAHLAAALLPSLPCGCERADQKLHELRSLMADKNGNLYTSQPQLEQAAALFGISYRGAIEAMQLIAPIAHMRAL